MIYELLLENFMYPNIAANLPRAFPRYKLSDEDYTLKLFINEAKEITILGHIDNNFLMWLSKGTLSYIKLSSTLEFLLHKRLPHVVSQYELEKCGYPNQGAWILFSAKYFIKRADDGWRIETGTGWITGRGLTPGHELSGVFSNGLALADVIIRDYKRYISLLERNSLLEDNSVREEFFWIHEYFMHDYYTLMGKLHGDRFAGE